MPACIDRFETIAAAHHAVICVDDAACRPDRGAGHQGDLKSGDLACHTAAVLGTLPFMKIMKNLIWLFPLLISLGAMLLTVEMKSQTREVTINYDVNNLFDTRGRLHSVRLVLHPNGSVTWLDLTGHIR